MQKVRVEVIHPWIAKRVSEMLGFEDEVVINMIYGQLEDRVSH
jgi:serine/arginine repetitive matrix protein 1